MANDRFISRYNNTIKKTDKKKHCLEKGFMKKLLYVQVIIFVLVFFCSCNPDTPSSSVIPNPSEERTSKYVHVRTTEETLDSVKYTVKTYADVNKDEPYFYIYYKYYYLDGILRAVYSFDHTGNVNLDYAYTEFVEHICFNGTCSHRLTSYDENGKVASISYVSSSERLDSSFYPNGKLKKGTRYSGDGTIVECVECYETGVYKQQLQYYENGALRNETTYYENGQKETVAAFETDGKNLSHYWEYYETGVMKEYISYSNGVMSVWYKYSPEGKETETIRYSNGVMREWTKYSPESKETETTWYHEDGSLSEYTLYGADRKIKYSISYSLNSGKVTSSYEDYHENGKIRLRYSMTDDVIDWFSFHFSSGYCQYYYEDGTLYEYDDGISQNGYVTVWGYENVSDYGGIVGISPVSKKDFSRAKTSTALTEQEAQEWIERLHLFSPPPHTAPIPKTNV